MRERDRDRALDIDLLTVDGWLPASVPGTVHQDLMAAGRIPDPFLGTDEEASQWVGERDWLYRCDFHSPVVPPGATVDLCFDGLDTVTTVWLNGERLLDSDDMFVPQRVAVTDLLRPHVNHLVIEFTSPLRAARAREEQHGRSLVWNGDPARVHLRKAQYHFGWDWGPCLLTMGPWQEVRLEVHEGRLVDVDCRIDLAADHATAVVDVLASVTGSASGRLVRFGLGDPDGAASDPVDVIVPAAGDGEACTVQGRFTVERPSSLVAERRRRAAPLPRHRQSARRGR